MQPTLPGGNTARGDAGGRWARWFLYAGLPVATLTLGVVLARADVPNLFSDGDTLSAAKMNDNFKSLDARLAGLEGKVSTLEGKVSALEGELASVKTANAELQSALAADPDCPADYAIDSSAAPFVVCKKGPDEVVKVGRGAAAFWVDRYEASAWETPGGGGAPCGQAFEDYDAACKSGFAPSGQLTKPFYAVSKRDVRPSGYLTWFQAQAACAASGKMLPSVEQWQLAARGTNDPGKSPGSDGQCVTSASAPHLTGHGTLCRSEWGAEDMIGNVWEWTEHWYVTVGVNKSPTSPELDVFSQVTSWGQLGASTPNSYESAYNGDGIWGIVSGGWTTQNSGGMYEQVPTGFQRPSAAIMGGSFAAGTMAGVFAIALDNTVSFSVDYIGFRCVVPRSRG